MGEEFRYLQLVCEPAVDVRDKQLGKRIFFVARLQEHNGESPFISPLSPICVLWLFVGPVWLFGGNWAIAK